LEGDPPSGNDGNGGKPEGESLSPVILEGEVEQDGVRSIIIVSGEGDLSHPGKGDCQVDLFPFLARGHLKKQLCFLHP